MTILPVNKFGTLTEEDCIQIQKSLACHVQQKNHLQLEQIKTVGGVDLAYWTDDKAMEHAVCCIVILDVQNSSIIEKTSATGIVTVPYVPGCLAFRELPLVVEAAAQLKMQPDVYMFDGNGLLHPRRMGLATHASFYLNRPTLGVAKTYFKIGDTQFTMPENEANTYTDVIVDHDVCARAVRTHKNVKPIFVSVGNYIDLDTTTSLTLSLVDSSSHIPLPTRYADLETHNMRTILKHES